jgi:putative solute:sodium symporter small subunit
MSSEKMTHIRILYWRRARRLTAILMTAWFCMTFGMIFFARELARFTLFGWPFSFYMAGQGLTLFYLLVVATYMIRMRKLDKMLKEETTDAE